MAGFTLTDLRQVVAQCFEGADAEALDAAALDTRFTDLGYDSIVVYEIVVRIQDDHGVSIPDEALDELDTPGALIAYVDARVPASQ